MIEWMKEKFDRIILNDHEYKRKYCPFIYNYLFIVTSKERTEMFKKMIENTKGDKK